MPTETTEHYFTPSGVADECNIEGCTLGVLDHPEPPKHNAATETTLPAEVAAKLIQLRDTLAKMESSELVNEAWHTLYSIADPEIASFFPWAELERLAAIASDTRATAQPTPASATQGAPERIYTHPASAGSSSNQKGGRAIDGK